MNKVKFYLKRAYYAPAEIADDGTVTYQTPIRMPGAVSISFSPEGDLISLRADGCDYYTGADYNRTGHYKATTEPKHNKR